jgi:hypothetical protein
MKKFLILALCATAALAQMPHRKVNRAHVCPPDASKWCFAASEAGGFSLLLPAAFDDVTGWSELSNGEKPAMYSLEAKTREGIKITAECAFNPAQPANDRTAQEVVMKFLTMDPDSKAASVSSAGLKGYEVSMGKSGSAGIVRVLPANSAIYMIFIDYPPGKAGPAAKIASKILASFAVQRPPRKLE